METYIRISAKGEVVKTEFDGIGEDIVIMLANALIESEDLLGLVIMATHEAIIFKEEEQAKNN